MFNQHEQYLKLSVVKIGFALTLATLIHQITYIAVPEWKLFSFSYVTVAATSINAKCFVSCCWSWLLLRVYNISIYSNFDAVNCIATSKLSEWVDVILMWKNCQNHFHNLAHCSGEMWMLCRSNSERKSLTTSPFFPPISIRTLVQCSMWSRKKTFMLQSVALSNLQPIRRDNSWSAPS